MFYGYFYGISPFPPFPGGKVSQLQDVPQRITGFEMWNARQAILTTQFRQPGSRAWLRQDRLNKKTNHLVGPAHA